MLSRQKVGFWLCMNDFLSLSLFFLTYLREFFFSVWRETNLFVLLLFHCIELLFSLCPTIAVTRMHDILSHSIMSHTVAPNAHKYIYIHIERVSSMSVSKKKVWIDIYHTSFSILGAPLNCFQPIAICMRRSFIVHCCRHYSMMVYNMWL
jgi:hypothetical protein